MMSEISKWLSPADIQSIPDYLRSKIDTVLINYHAAVLSLQSDVSLKTTFYEKTIEDLNKRLKEENQKFLEMEMRALGSTTSSKMFATTSMAKKETATTSMASSRRSATLPMTSGKRSALRRKLQAAIHEGKEAELRERALKAQVRFLTENYSEDSRELCEIVGGYLEEIGELKRRLEEGRYDGVEGLKRELEGVRMNERELQRHVHEKAKELHGLYDELNGMRARNGVLEQYRVKCKEQHEECVRMAGQLSERRGLDEVTKAFGEEIGRVVKEEMRELRREVEHGMSGEVRGLEEVKDEVRGVKSKLDGIEEELRGIVDKTLRFTSESSQDMIGQGSQGMVSQTGQIGHGMVGQGMVSHSMTSQEHIRELEEEAERYKDEAKRIERAFEAYKKLYEKTNIDELKRRIEILRENVTKKNILLGKMGELIEKYKQKVY